jgi:hypothetical protein
MTALRKYILFSAHHQSLIYARRLWTNKLAKLIMEIRYNSGQVITILPFSIWTQKFSPLTYENACEIFKLELIWMFFSLKVSHVFIFL